MPETLTKYDTHTERIWCPECEHEQEAEVEHTWPWWSYVHTCEACSYIIMESEWNPVEVHDA